MGRSQYPPGPLESQKRADDPETGLVEPQAAEVESARLLMNEARPRLEGLEQEELRRLADEFVARDRGGDVDSFVDWVRQRPAGRPAGSPT